MPEKNLKEGVLANQFWMTFKKMYEKIVTNMVSVTITISRITQEFTFVFCSLNISKVGRKKRTMLPMICLLQSSIQTSTGRFGFSFFHPNIRTGKAKKTTRIRSATSYIP